MIIAQEAGLYMHGMYSCILKSLYKPNDFFLGAIKFIEDSEEAKISDINL